MSTQRMWRLCLCLCVGLGVLLLAACASGGTIESDYSPPPPATSEATLDAHIDKLLADLVRERGGTGSADSLESMLMASHARVAELREASKEHLRKTEPVPQALLHDLEDARERRASLLFRLYAATPLDVPISGVPLMAGGGR